MPRSARAWSSISPSRSRASSRTLAISTSRPWVRRAKATRPGAERSGAAGLQPAPLALAPRIVAIAAGHARSEAAGGARCRQALGLDGRRLILLGQQFVQPVAVAVGLGVQVTLVLGGDLAVDRLAGDDVDAGMLQGFDLARVVGQQQDLVHAELVEHLVGDAEVALVLGKTDDLVSVDGVEALVLQAIGAQLVGEPDAATFLRQVEQHAAALGADRGHAAAQLLAAVAAQ